MPRNVAIWPITDRPSWVILACLGPVLLLTLAAATQGAAAAASCRPGDVQIGEDDKFVYCSHTPCDQMAALLGRDQDALRRQQRTDDANNAALQEWAKQNDAAAKSALQHASDLLVDSLIEATGEHFEEKLAAVENDFARRRPGETITMSLERVRDLRIKAARLDAVVSGIKLAQYPGKNVAELWEALKDHAEKAGAEGEVLATAWRDARRDPELARTLEEHGARFAADTLKLALKPFAQKSLDFGSFIVDYGYDTWGWLASRERILQDAANADTALRAECALDRQLKSTVRDLNICNGRYPDADKPDPDEVTCGGSR